MIKETDTQSESLNIQSASPELAETAVESLQNKVLQLDFRGED